MKIISCRVEVKQGLPNYSSRAAELIAVADEGESLDVNATINALSSQIKQAWDPELRKATEQAPMHAPTRPVVVPQAIVEPKVARKKSSNPLDDD